MNLLLWLFFAFVVSAFDINKGQEAKYKFLFDFDKEMRKDTDLALQRSLREKLTEEIMQKTNKTRQELDDLEFNQLLNYKRPTSGKAPNFVKEFLKKPLVGIEEEQPEYTLEDYITFAAAIADGLNWEDDYANSIDCVYKFADLGIRL